VSEIVPASAERVRFRAVAEAHPGTPRFGAGWTATSPGYARPAHWRDCWTISGAATPAPSARAPRLGPAGWWGGGEPPAGLAGLAARPVNGLGGDTPRLAVLLALVAGDYSALRLL